MKRILRLAVAAMLVALPLTAMAQDKKAERRARREQKKAEMAMLDSLARLTENNEMIDLGYGKVRKRDLTTSVSKMKVNKNSAASYTDIGEYLMGRVPGLTVQRIGDTYKYSIRSTATVYGDTDPLFVVDGIKTDDISYLNPSDVDHVEVLKDAASASIYGTESGNGVILITTRKE